MNVYTVLKIKTPFLRFLSVCWFRVSSEMTRLFYLLCELWKSFLKSRIKYVYMLACNYFVHEINKWTNITGMALDTIFLNNHEV